MKLHTFLNHGGNCEHAVDGDRPLWGLIPAPQIDHHRRVHGIIVTPSYNPSMLL